jgi:plastocyanin
MTKKFWSAVMGVSLLMSSVGCSEGTTPFAPSKSAMNDFGPASGSTASTIDSYPVVTLKPDLTVDPAVVTVQAGDQVLMVNNSDRTVRIRSYCQEFLIMYLGPGASKYTWSFGRTGETCDYFAWDANWSQKIFVGQVVVQ